MSLHGMVHDGVAARVAGRLAERLRGRPDETAADVATPETLADQIAALPSGSMRVLEAVIAVAAILTALLIGIR